MGSDKRRLYRQRTIVYVLGFLLMVAMLYVEDEYFTDRWEWPTFILMPFLVAHASLYSLPAFLISMINIRTLPVMVLQSTGLFGVGGSIKSIHAALAPVVPFESGLGQFFAILTIVWVVTCTFSIASIVLERRFTNGDTDP